MEGTTHLDPFALGIGHIHKHVELYRLNRDTTEPVERRKDLQPYVRAAVDEAVKKMREEGEIHVADVSMKYDMDAANLKNNISFLKYPIYEDDTGEHIGLLEDDAIDKWLQRQIDERKRKQEEAARKADKAKYLLHTTLGTFRLRSIVEVAKKGGIDIHALRKYMRGEGTPPEWYIEVEEIYDGE